MHAVAARVHFKSTYEYGLSTSAFTCLLQPKPYKRRIGQMPTGDVTRLLAQLRSGDAKASDQLVALVYSELRNLAASCMRRERPGHTLQATALVHEAYFRLVGQHDVEWQNRAHF